MARCNRCIYEDIKNVAARVGGVVSTESKPTSYAPTGVDIFIKYPISNELVWAAWLMKLPPDCVCHE